MNISHIFRLYREDAKDLTDQTIRVSDEVVRVIRQDVEHKVELTPRASLDDELFIVAEEEE